MTIDWIDIVVTVLTAGVFALIGFVWKWSHKVTSMEKDVSANKNRLQKMEADHDKVMDRMYSIAKDRASMVSRESYRADSAEMSRMIEMARYENDMKKGEQ